MQAQSNRLTSRRQAAPQTLTLADGRRLGFRRYGDPAGIAVCYHHGMPGAGAEAALLDAEAWIAGIQLLAMDRPGIGLSSPHAYPDLRCCADDWLRLLDALHIDQAHQIGWSSGGPIALAMAITAPARVQQIIVVASYTHFTESPPMRNHLLQPNHPAHYLISHRPYLLPLALYLMRWTENLLPSLYLHLFGQVCSPADRQALQEIRAGFLQAQRQAFRQGVAGPAHDLALQYQDWGFRLGEITRPVLLIQGQDDSLVGMEMAQDLAGRLPDCTLWQEPKAGHLLPLQRDFQRWLFRRIKRQG